MPWGWGGRGGRGFRWMFWLTGLPGWARFGYSYPSTTTYPSTSTTAYPTPYAAAYPGNWFWRCRWFPWLPRWWWTGIYGPVQWTPQGPVISQPSVPTTPVQTTDIEYLKQQKQALEQELKAIEDQLRYIEERIKQLGGEK